jgi:hypothetical protein
MQTSAEFLDEIETFLRENHVAPSTFGRVVMDDPTFIFALRKGRVPSLDVCARISKIISHQAAWANYAKKIK